MGTDTSEPLSLGFSVDLSFSACKMVTHIEMSESSNGWIRHKEKSIKENCGHIQAMFR